MMVVSALLRGLLVPLACAMMTPTYSDVRYVLYYPIHLIVVHAMDKAIINATSNAIDMKRI